MESIIRIAEALNARVGSLFSDEYRAMSLDGEQKLDDLTFRKAFENALHLILITDADGQILRVNSSVLDYSGHLETDLVGVSLLNASLWQNYNDASLVLKKGLQQARWGNLFHETMNVVSHEGTEHEAVCFISPVFKDDQDDKDEPDIDLLIVECYLKSPESSE